MNRSISVISNEQEAQLAELLNPERFIKLQQAQLHLRKLPLVGDASVSDSDINFEYPKSFGLDILGDPDSLRLRSLFFMSVNEDFQPLSRVTCIYENGHKSPNISCASANHEQ